MRHHGQTIALVFQATWLRSCVPDALRRSVKMEGEYSVEKKTRRKFLSFAGRSMVLAERKAFTCICIFHVGYISTMLLQKGGFVKAVNFLPRLHIFPIASGAAERIPAIQTFNYTGRSRIRFWTRRLFPSKIRATKTTDISQASIKSITSDVNESVENESQLAGNGRSPRGEVKSRTFDLERTRIFLHTFLSVDGPGSRNGRGPPIKIDRAKSQCSRGESTECKTERKDGPPR